MKTPHLLYCFIALILAQVSTRAAEQIHVLIWDELQPRQSEAYANFLGNEIAVQLKAVADDIETRSVALDDPEQGLSDENLDWANVVIWWGHVRQNEVTPETAERLLSRVRDGKLDLIALHSAHWSTPFVEAMNWRSREDARAHIAKTDPGHIVTFEMVPPPRPYTVPAHSSALTPAIFCYKDGANYKAIVYLPWCCFPDYRPDGRPSTLAVKLAEHPIAKGLPATLQVRQTEMYNEPFHVPAPDEVVFEETWESGEHFRAGILWNIGQGKVFYFRPGHETYPVYKQPEMISVIVNAVRYFGQ